jgi:hypothetical protein
MEIANAIHVYALQTNPNIRVLEEQYPEPHRSLLLGRLQRRRLGKGEAAALGFGRAGSKAAIVSSPTLYSEMGERRHHNPVMGLILLCMTWPTHRELGCGWSHHGGTIDLL